MTVFEVRLAPLEGWGQHGSELIVLWAAVTSTGQREVTDQLHTVLAIYILGGGAGRGGEGRGGKGWGGRGGGNELTAGASSSAASP